jgi:arabinogalactan oligomer/maltooligosaccharide transport system substrate-binding protein
MRKTMNGAALAILLAGLSMTPAAAAAQTELVLWHAYRGAERAAFEKVVANFNKEQGGAIAVSTLPVPWDAMPDKITAAVPRGKGPDLMIYPQDRLGGWVEAGNTIEPIDFYLEDEIVERFIPTTMQAMTYQDTVYGLPLNFKVITQIYNKKLVKMPPKTSTELVATAKKLTDAATGRFGLAYAYQDFYYHASLMNAFGGAVFDAAGKPTMNSAANIKALDYLLGWMDRDKILPAEPSTALITTLFNEGKAAIVFSGPWFLGEIAEGVDYGLAPLPEIVEAGSPMRPWMTVEGLYIAAPSAHKEEAYEFVKYVTDLPSARIMALEGRQTPANSKVYDDPKVAADAQLASFRGQVAVAVPMPNRPEMAMVWSPATTAMNVITKKTATPKNAMDQAQKEVTERVAALLK